LIFIDGEINMQNRKKVSIVAPCYNEEDNIRPFYERVTETMSQFPQLDYEIIIADNCSQDSTVNILRGISAEDKRVKVILNGKNFKTRSGLNAFNFFSGECLISLATDLEDPPELIADFLRHWEAGKKVVVAVKAGSKEGLVMRQIRKLYYNMINSISSVEQIKNYTGFGLYDRSVIGPILNSGDPEPYMRGLISEFAYDIAVVEFLRPVRSAGKSSHNFFSLFNIAMMGVTSYSKVPIRIATISGMFLSLISLLVAVFYFIIKMIWWPHIPFGMAPLIMGMFFFASVQILFLGLIGEYVSAILIKVTPKPLVMVREYINFEEEEGKS